MPSVLSPALPTQGFGVVCARCGAGDGIGSLLLLEHWRVEQFPVRICSVVFCSAQDRVVVEDEFLTNPRNREEVAVTGTAR